MCDACQWLPPIYVALCGGFFGGASDIHSPSSPVTACCCYGSCCTGSCTTPQQLHKLGKEGCTAPADALALDHHCMLWRMAIVCGSSLAGMHTAQPFPSCVPCCRRGPRCTSGRHLQFGLWLCVRATWHCLCCMTMLWQSHAGIYSHTVLSLARASCMLCCRVDSSAPLAGTCSLVLASCKADWPVVAACQVIAVVLQGCTPHSSLSVVLVLWLKVQLRQAVSGGSVAPCL